MTMDQVRVGQLGRAHGIHGEIALDGASLTAEELEQVKTFTWRKAGARRVLVLEGARPIHGRVLVRFAGIGDRERAAELTLGELLVERSQLPATGPGEAYTFELVGLTVQDASGRSLGRIIEVMRTAAHPIWVVRGEKELLVPVTDLVVQNVDLEAGVITVRLPAGLEEL
jgi:16S rRNA processing protein RimM